MRLKLFILAIIFAALFIGYKIFTGPSDAPVFLGIKSSGKVNLDTPAQQASYLVAAFQRKHSLGFSVQDITFDDNDTTSLSTKPALVYKQAIADNWQLGKGQLVGVIDIDNPDVAFYRIGVESSSCPTVIKAPLATAEQWQNAFQAGKAMFEPNDDTPLQACFKSDDDKFIFYQLVYVAK